MKQGPRDKAANTSNSCADMLRATAESAELTIRLFCHAFNRQYDHLSDRIKNTHTQLSAHETNTEISGGFIVNVHC